MEKRCNHVFSFVLSNIYHNLKLYKVTDIKATSQVLQLKAWLCVWLNHFFLTSLIYKARNLASRASTSGTDSLLEIEPRSSISFFLLLSALQASFSAALILPVDL